MTEFPRAGRLVVLAVVASSVVAYEVLLTRLLSVTSWYGQAFLVLSLAMIGLARGSILAMSADDADPRQWVARQLMLASLGMLAGTAVALVTPMTIDTDVSALGAALVVAFAATLPLIATGAVVARLLAQPDVPIGLMYAIDLVGAALGALAPLVLLGPLSAPAALLLLAAILAVVATLVAAPRQRTRTVAVAALVIAVFALTRWTHSGLELHFTKGSPRPPRDTIALDEWNALSHVTLSNPSPQYVPLWSPSPDFHPPILPVAMATIDGEAATPVYPYHRLEDLEYLHYDATATAHVLRPGGAACVIGIGGGRDLETALIFGHDPVFGAEINPAMVDVLHTARSYSPIEADPRVHIAIGDGRSLLASHAVHCHVLQASLVDTWAATGAGAFAHAESTLYTREAWNLFLERVAPDGIVTFSRWFDPQQLNETARLVSLAMASLIDAEVPEPRAHLALVAAGRVATVLVSPSRLTAQDLAGLELIESRLHFTMLILPSRLPADPVLRRLVQARSIDELARAGADEGLDTSPPSDDRPFFFQLLAPRAWLHPIATARRARQSGGVIAGNVVATLELLVTFLAAAILAVALLGPTLARARKATRPPLPSWRASAYFGLLGAGFMLVEIALVQRLHVVLGHPSYALIVVLAGLLVATGVGSLVSPLLVRSRRSVSVVAAIAAVLLAALPFAVIRPVAAIVAGASLARRMLFAGACAASAGIVLGMLFPSGLRFVDRERGTPVALALNGVTSVLGSVAAVLISVWAGIPTTLVIAAILYACAAALGPWGWPSEAA